MSFRENRKIYWKLNVVYNVFFVCKIKNTHNQKVILYQKTVLNPGFNFLKMSVIQLKIIIKFGMAYYLNLFSFKVKNFPPPNLISNFS